MRSASNRGPCSKAREYDSQTVVQPCIWFKEEPSSSPWAKQHRVEPVLSWRNHIQGWMNVRKLYSGAVEQGPLGPRSRRERKRHSTDSAPATSASHADRKVFTLHSRSEVNTSRAASAEVLCLQPKVHLLDHSQAWDLRC